MITDPALPVDDIDIFVSRRLIFDIDFSKRNTYIWLQTIATETLRELDDMPPIFLGNSVFQGKFPRSKLRFLFLLRSDFTFR